MQRSAKGPQGKGSLELIEEATHLVRTAPLAALAGYYAGSLPFVLALLYFWGDMSRSPFAGQHLAEAALGLAGLFIWMKFWQARFAARLRRGLAAVTVSDTGSARNHPAVSSTDGKVSVVSAPRHMWRLLRSQIALQPLGLFFLALALVLTLPFAWVYAFFQNLTVLAESEAAPAPLVRKAARLAALWPKQNHLVLAILTGFALFVFMNLAMFCFLLPGLIKTLFGIESVFTRSGVSLLNSTFFAAMAGLTYLCVDPLVKAVYTLRCFYGESLESGEDLKADLRQLTGPASGMVAALIVLMSVGHVQGQTDGSQMVRTWAEAASISIEAEPPYVGSYSLDAEADAEPGNLSPPQLDQAIRRVIQQRKYTWRAPRDKVIEEEETNEGVLGRFLARAEKLVAKWVKAVGNWLDRLLRKLFRGGRQVQPVSAGYSWMVWLQMLLYLLIAAAVVGLGFLAYRVWRERRRPPPAIASEPIQPVPDLADLNVGPEQLPEDGWTKLARELAARGEWRLALRAFYLASLAHLAARHLISLAQFKSNRDYERELRRRAHSLPDLLVWFSENVTIFDGVWYGRHAIDREQVGQFAANVDAIKTATA